MTKFVVMINKGLLLSILCLINLCVFAQEPARQTKIKLLSKEWLLQKTETDGKVILPSVNLPHFRLVLHDNEKCEQGLPPDGMINGSWKLSDDMREIIFIDKNPSLKNPTSYSAKIILINTTQLILSITTNNHISTLYYSLE